MTPVRTLSFLVAAGLALSACSSTTSTTHQPSPSAASSRTTHDASPSPAHSGTSTHFGYEGAEGPEHWGTLDAGWAACSTGTRQSPIDLPSGTPTDLPDLDLGYPASTWSLVDTGHALQAVPSKASQLVRGGTTWTLRQFHLHTPSEHTIGSRQAAGELHLVHQDARGRLLVIGVLLQEGARNPAWGWLEQELPSHEGGPTATTSAASPRSLLPASLAHRTYTGSLTTPPCTEGVTWVVLDEPVTLSSGQLQRIHEVGGTNARPVQDLDGRGVGHDATAG